MNETENNRLAELLIELAAGNTDVLTEIDLRMQKILYFVGIMYFKNKQDTEDSIQEIYIVLNTKAKDFRQNVSASAWIVAIYKNWVKSKLRKRKAEERYVKEEMQDLKTRGNPFDDKYTENYTYLKEALGKLNRYERELVVYYHLCECTVREVAEMLHRPRATVDYHLRKLNEKLKRAQEEKEQHT